MAKKKATRKKAKKRPAAKKNAAKRKKAAPPAKKKVAAKTGKKRAAKKKSRKKVKAKSLGRPRIAGGAKLDQFFQKDYQAREIFEFLGVHTLRELEAFGPDEIIGRLTAPMVQTVQRIRKTLAMVNRSLSDDRDFALEFKQQI